MFLKGFSRAILPASLAGENVIMAGMVVAMTDHELEPAPASEA
jgi:hypothetical protein